jgi:hypothetical protein
MPFLRPDHLWSRPIVTIARVFISFLCAGLANFIWLAAFLTFSEKPPGGPASWLLWFLAPPTIALGYSLGIILFDWYALRCKGSLFSVLPLPLAGCVIGAVLAFQLGPMFIGFGTLAIGGIAVVIREVWLSRKQ